MNRVHCQQYMTQRMILFEDSVNSNTEGDMLEEHCSHSPDAATAPVEIDSDLHQDPVSAPSIGIDSDHQDASSTNV